jgi:two-component system response regulator HydG
MSDAILLVDDDAVALRTVGGHLEQQGFEVARELDAAGAMAACDRLEPDVAVLDLGVPAGDGPDLLALLRQRGIPVIGVLDAPDDSAATQALRRGADHVLVRGASPELLAATVARVADATRRRRAAEASLSAPGVSLDALGTSSAMRAVGQQIVALAQSDRTTVLIHGEAGVGKAWIARLIHDLGARAREPFLEAWCSGTDAVTLETRLFGVERGALPDTRRRLRGRLELASQGTLLLREVGSLPLELQPVLLRTLESRSFRRVGGQRDVSAQARLIVTSSRDLAAEVEHDRFRGDLHYRLSTMVLTVPPLRERSDADRLVLITGLHAALATRAPEPPLPFAPESLERLMTHTWPGNVRELAGVVERSALVARVAGQQAILLEHLPGELRARPGLGDRRHTPMSLEETEKQQIERSLRFHGGNRTRAAKELRISRATLINKIKRYGITE